MEINDYPSKTVENIIKNELEKEKFNIINEPQTNTTDNSETKLNSLRKAFLQMWNHALHTDVQNFQHNFAWT